MHLCTNAYLNKTHRWLLHFFFVNLLIIYLVSFHYLSQAFPLRLFEFHHGDFHLVNNLTRWIATTYLILTYISFFSLLVIITLLGPFIISVFSKNPKIVVITSILCISTLITLLLIDSYVFSIYHVHLNQTIVAMILSPFRQEIFYFSPYEWLLFALGIISLVLVEAGLTYFLWHKHRLSFAQSIVKIIMISLILAMVSLFSSLLLFNRNLMQLSTIFPFYNDVSQLLFSFSPQESNCFSTNHFYPEQHHQTQPQLHYPRHPFQCAAQTTPLNIFIIVIDAWRFDAMNQQITPHLAQLAAENVYFQHHISGGNATKPGIFSLFYGLPATYWQPMLDQKQSPALIRQLIKNHYQFGIFSSASLAIPDFASTIFNLIPNLQISTPRQASYERDQTVTQRFQTFITNRHPQQPIFSFIFYDAVHAYCEHRTSTGPFQPELDACNHFALNPHYAAKPLFNRYANSVYFVDQQIEHVLNTIKEAQLWDNSIVIVTSDHGEEFNDNQLNYWGHTSNFTKYQTQVPLIIHWPGKPHQNYKHVTTHYDIATTLMRDALGCRSPYRDYSYGSHLFSTKQRYPIIVSNNYEAGYLTPNHITTLFTSGHFIIQDSNGHDLLDKKPNKIELRHILKQLNQFKRSN